MNPNHSVTSLDALREVLPAGVQELETEKVLDHPIPSGLLRWPSRIENQ